MDQWLMSTTNGKGHQLESLWRNFPILLDKLRLVGAEKQTNDIVEKWVVEFAKINPGKPRFFAIRLARAVNPLRF